MAKKADLIRKFKENATKYIQKGNYDKALEQYRQLAKLEPSDLRFRMKVGECLSKLNKKKEAVLEYNEIAKEYTKEGFLIQAIAICKLILQLDPTATEAQNLVAELNSRRGIVTDKKPRIQPALSLAGIKGPIPSAVQPEAAIAPEPEPIAIDEEIPEPEEEAALIDETAVEEPEMEEAPLEAPSVENNEPELADLAEPEPAPVAPPQRPTPPRPAPLPDSHIDLQPHEGTVENPIPLEEAHEGVEEEAAEIQSEYPVFPETPLFSDLNVDEFKRIVGKFQIGTLPKGITVIKEGSRGDSFFIVAGGKVRVFKWSANQKRKMTLAILEEGSFFGEFAFLTNSTRSASVETVEECVLLRINRKDLDDIIKEFPHIREVMNEFYKKRVLETLLMISPLFESLSDSDRREIITKFESVELDTGDMVIREGEEGKALYLIKHGAIDITVKHRETGQAVLVATLKEGDFFGEISLLQNKPTTATCTAKIPTSMFRLPKASFNEMIMIHPQILETVSAAVDERLRSTTKHLTAREEDRQNEGLV